MQIMNSMIFNTQLASGFNIAYEKKLIWFFPYFFSNVAITTFIVTFCFLLWDSLSEPSLRPTLHFCSWVLLFLVLFSCPRYLIKGVIPWPFQKGIKRGFWIIIQVITLYGAWLLWFKNFIGSNNLIPMYWSYMGLSFLFAIYNHYFWGCWLKKKANTNQ